MPHFYNLTLSKTSAVTCAVYGNFSAPKAQEIVVAKGSTLELLRPDDQNRLQTVISINCFGLIRSLETFRLVGANRDYLLVGSDSGRMVILEYNTTKNVFDKVHQETYGKTGCRRTVPGQYLAVDPKGRSCMVSAVERQKFVYILNRDLQSRLTISSPLEAHKSYTIVFATVGLDVGFDNPQFAAIECQYDDFGKKGPNPQKLLTIYEMDLGVNHVTRKHSDKIPFTAHDLIPVPGGTDGPGGVLLCCENFLVIRCCPAPCQGDWIPLPKRALMVVCWSRHKLKNFFFFLIQSEYGDLYKVTLTHKEGVVSEVQCSYFDSIPVAISICVLKTGFLFAASEFGNHSLENAVVAFKPRTLKNLTPFDELSSLAPITDMKVMDCFSTQTQVMQQDGSGMQQVVTTGMSVGCQIYALSGRGPRSALRILRHGLTLGEAGASELPGQPNALFTIKPFGASYAPVPDGEVESDRYIVVSFVDQTLTLLVTSDNIHEVTDSGFAKDQPTLFAMRMADKSAIQVMPTGIRHVAAGRRTTEWRAPPGRQVTMAASNGSQVVIALSGGEIQLFELDADTNGHLSEVAKRDIGCEVAALTVQPLSSGRTRSQFMAVAGVDSSALRTTASSVCMLQFGQGTTATIYLAIGLEDGVLVRSVIDGVTGTALRSEAESPWPSSGDSVPTDGRRWPSSNGGYELEALPLCFQANDYSGAGASGGQYQCVPLTFAAAEDEDAPGSSKIPALPRFDLAAPFSIENCQEGICTTSQRVLRIVSVERLNETFNQVMVPLSYTGRKFLPLPPPKLLSGQVDAAQMDNRIMLAVMESDHNTYNEETKTEIREALKKIKVDAGEEGDADMDPPAESQASGALASEWSILSPLPTSFKLDLDVDEAATAMTVCYFYQLKDNRPCLVVGTATGVDPHNPSRSAHGKCYIKTYLYDESYNLQLIHVTPLEGVPSAMYPFEGRLLVALRGSPTVAPVLRRVESCGSDVNKDRIFAADSRDSIMVLRWRYSDNQMQVISDDTYPRCITAAAVLDYNTIVVGDKFDNIAILRVPSDAKDAGAWGRPVVEAEGISTLRLVPGRDNDYVSGNTFKMDLIGHFHVGETITSLQRVTMVAGGAEIVIYSTVLGTIGALYPFSSKREHNFLQALEMHMRNTAASPSLSGREHVMYRSFYHPIKNFIDADLCEVYYQLPAEKQRQIAVDMDKTPQEVMKKLEDIHTISSNAVNDDQPATAQEGELASDASGSRKSHLPNELSKEERYERMQEAARQRVRRIAPGGSDGTAGGARTIPSARPGSENRRFSGEGSKLRSAKNSTQGQSKGSLRSDSLATPRRRGPFKRESGVPGSVVLEPKPLRYAEIHCAEAASEDGDARTGRQLESDASLERDGVEATGHGRLGPEHGTPTGWGSSVGAPVENVRGIASEHASDGKCSEEKVVEARSLKAAEEMRECTFSPRVTPRKLSQRSASVPRDLDSIYRRTRAWKDEREKALEWTRRRREEAKDEVDQQHLVHKSVHSRVMGMPYSTVEASRFYERNMEWKREVDRRSETLRQEQQQVASRATPPSAQESAELLTPWVYVGRQRVCHTAYAQDAGYQ
ncbi:Splicing factor 3B subunit 3 [Perkinsus olseni]|uniref:Splicing factor 3B subunit 3 n=1 Tax=Perkinsus olseni TaxID=32597 RepID=A0A7J6P536_PEROL|nr:Splicing factor 3B subunit 3 [Perkinsus olseni]